MEHWSGPPKKYFMKTLEKFASDVSRIAQSPPQLSVLTQTLAKNLARLLLRLVTQTFPVNLSGTAKFVRLTCARGEGSFFLRITGWCRLHNTPQQTQNVLTGAVQDGLVRHRCKHVETHCCLWLKKKRTHRQSHSRLRSLSWHTLRRPDRLAAIQRETWGTVRKIAPILPLAWRPQLRWTLGYITLFTVFLRRKLAFPWHTYTAFRETFHFIQTPCSRVSLFKPRQRHCCDLTTDCYPLREICVPLTTDGRALQLNIAINT